MVTPRIRRFYHLSNPQLLIIPLAEVFGNVLISDDDTEQVIPILFKYLSGKSKIVKYCSMQTLGILEA